MGCICGKVDPNTFLVAHPAGKTLVEGLAGQGPGKVFSIEPWAASKKTNPPQMLEMRDDSGQAGVSSLTGFLVLQKGRGKAISKELAKKKPKRESKEKSKGKQWKLKASQTESIWQWKPKASGNQRDTAGQGSPNQVVLSVSGKCEPREDTTIVDGTGKMVAVLRSGIRADFGFE